MKFGLIFFKHDSQFSSSRPSVEQAKKWAQSFHELIASKYGAALYAAFLQQEYSQENLEFWTACERFKNTKPAKRLAAARKIYNEFIDMSSHKMVNLDWETREAIVEDLHKANVVRIFDRAQRYVQFTMESDSYVRFLQSNLYLELVRGDTSFSCESCPGGNSSSNSVSSCSNHS